MLEDDASSARYDAGTGYLTVTLTKAHEGEDFKDLDILASLLAPHRQEQPKVSPMIEVLQSESNGSEGGIEEILDADEREILEGRSIIRSSEIAGTKLWLAAAENDWQLPQRPQIDEDASSIRLSTKQQYGFLDMYTGYFSHVSHTENEVNELGPDAENLTVSERRLRRLSHEDEKWDEDHYM